MLTPADLRAAFPGAELPQALGLAQLIDPVTKRSHWVVSQATDELLAPHAQAASAEAAAYLGARYELPFPVVPLALKGPLCDIARYRMAAGERTTEQISLRYSQAIKFLQLVARGEVSLGLEVAAERPVSRVRTNASPDQQTLARSRWTDW